MNLKFLFHKGLVCQACLRLVNGRYLNLVTVVPVGTVYRAAAAAVSASRTTLLICVNLCNLWIKTLSQAPFIHRLPSAGASPQPNRV